jgi:hypothetical protein
MKTPTACCAGLTDTLLFVFPWLFRQCPMPNTSRRTPRCRCSGVAPLLSTASLSLSLPYFTCRNVFATYTGLSLFPAIPPVAPLLSSSAALHRSLCPAFACATTASQSGQCRRCSNCRVLLVRLLHRYLTCCAPRLQNETPAMQCGIRARCQAAERTKTNARRDWRSMANAGRGPREPIHNRAGLA